MADPDHVAQLDAHDRLTVVLYRGGLLIAALGLVVAGIAGAAGVTWDPWPPVAAGTALAVLDMHLYDKRVRWIIAAAGMLGLVLLLSAPALADGAKHIVHSAGLGFVFVALSGFALKEQFCFRIPGLRLVPVMLAAAVFLLLFGLPIPAAFGLLPAGAVMAWLSFAKIRQPLHFDVGNKDAYQI
jgi:uncharacterized integral membrane protein